MSKRSQHTKDGSGDAVDNRKRKLAGILEESDSKECLTPSKRVTRSSTGTPLKQAVEAKKEEDYYSMFNREKYRRGRKGNIGDNEEDQEFYGPLGLPPKLMEISEFPETGKINSYSKTSYLKDITHILHGTDEFDIIRDSQFGSVFDISARKGALSGRLLHNMLCRLLLTRKRHELWFLFGNRPIRFSLREFAIVTGLNCGQFPPEREIKALKELAKKDDA